MGIVLNLPKDPYWINLAHGVRVKVNPCDTARLEAAKFYGQTHGQALVEEKEDLQSIGAEVLGIPSLKDTADRYGLSQMLFIQCLARSAIIDWKGVNLPGDPPVPAIVDDANVAMLMRIHKMADEFLEKYTRSHAEMVLEGNASGPRRMALRRRARILPGMPGRRTHLRRRRARPEREKVPVQGTRTANRAGLADLAPGGTVFRPVAHRGAGGRCDRARYGGRLADVCRTRARSPLCGGACSLRRSRNGCGA